MVDGEKRITSCSKCGAPREAGGYCKPCRKVYSAKYYADHREHLKTAAARYKADRPAEVAARRRRYRLNNREKLAAYEARRIRSPVYISAKRARYRATHSVEIAARKAVAYAIRTGLLTVQDCQDCDREPEKVNGRQVIEFHHAYGYEPENHLRGQWLCDECHRKRHCST